MGLRDSGVIQADKQICPKCWKNNTYGNGYNTTKNGSIPKYYCRGCCKNFQIGFKSADGFLKLYKAGYCLQEIATLHGVTRQYVGQVIKTHLDYIPRDRSKAMLLFHDKWGSPRYTLKSQPLTKCTICNGNVSTCHDGSKREICSKCWLKTPEGKARNAERQRKKKVFTYIGTE